MASETPDDFAAEAQRQMREYEAELAEYPHLVEVVGGYIAQSGYDYATEFVYGLDLILDALDKRRSGGALDAGIFDGMSRHHGHHGGAVSIGGNGQPENEILRSHQLDR